MIATAALLLGGCTGISADTTAVTAVTTVAGCDEVDRVPPESMAGDLSSWLRETESERGEVPQDLEVTIVDAVGQGGAWLLVANFSERFEPGVFAIDEERGFQVLWGGVASTDTEIRESMTSTAPELPPLLAECIDISGL